MRIPFSRPWRAFPELDGFTDEQCAAYARLAKRERLGSRVLVTFGAGFLSLVLALCGLWVGVWILESLGDMTRGSSASDLLSAVLLAVGAAGPSSLFFLAVRDRWLRWALRKHINKAHCPACGYVLLGLRVEDGAVVCPECGGRLVLADLGLTPESLLAADKERRISRGGAEGAEECISAPSSPLREPSPFREPTPSSPPPPA